MDAVPAGRQERDSQARARDREALRARRALMEGGTAGMEDGARLETPTRRQLRLQLAQGRAVDPTAHPQNDSVLNDADDASGAGSGAGSGVVPTDVADVDEAGGSTATVPSDAAHASGAGSGVVPTDADGEDADGEDADGEDADAVDLSYAVEAHPVPSDSGSPGAEENGAADPAVIRPSAGTSTPRDGSTTAGSSRDPLPGGRRDRRRQTDTGRMAQAISRAPGAAGDTGKDAAGADGGSAGTPFENAPATREALLDDARRHAVLMQGEKDPSAVDLEVLAQQKALAERAAVLNARARRVRELAEQVQPRTPVPNDPASAHNLSIVAPPEYLQVPGGSRAILRAPGTSHIPIVLPKPGREPTVPPAGSEETDPRVGSGRSGEPGSEPVEARSAFGLDPLDAMTAGLGRMRRVRYLQYSLLGVGAAALTTGIMMTVSSLNG
ncbi:hypothetical protein [Arthrobacter bussei]|uniref:hypothetical protein n=1 Tax=Arthrobacter bussei TaxID=2594179 RepID=UPI001785CE42|nr:hypothetical protein [Arthrobacter bussei]